MIYIVGGGTAGCVVASRLSNNPPNRVLLIEAAERDRSPWFSVPAASFKVSADPRLDWGYLTEAQDALEGRRIPLIQARLLGGGSSINGMVCTRGAASIFNAWRSMECDGADSVADSHLGVHGFSGPSVADASVMPVLINGNTSAAVMMIAERAADALGTPSA